MSDYAENNGSMDEHANEGRKPRTTEELLSSYLFDELDDVTRAEVEQAMQQDAGLVARLDELKETLSLLHRSAFDTENGELTSERRQALRAAAADAVGGKTGTPAAEPKKGKLLYFPAMKAAAAVALIAAGVFAVNEWQKPMLGVGYSADAGADEVRRLLEDSGYVESGNASDLGYMDSSSGGASTATERRLGREKTQSKPKEAGVIEMQANAPAEEVREKVMEEPVLAESIDSLELTQFGLGGGAGGGFTGGENKKAEDAYKDALGALGGRELFGQQPSATILRVDAAPTETLGYVQAPGQVDAPLKRDQVEVGALLATTDKGGTYIGPGDSVPPGKSAPPTRPSTPSTPSTPATPATPASPSTPAPGAKVGFDAQAWKKVADRKVADELEAAGDPDFTSDAAFDSDAWNNAVGVGDDASKGKYGARGGRGGGAEDADGEAPIAMRAEALSRKIDTRLAELQELKDLGYLDDSGEAISGDVDAATRYGFVPEVALEENVLGYYMDEAGGWRERRSGGEPRIIVCDGYGRYYRDTRVVEHLRPIEVNETARDMFFRYYGDNPFVSNAQDNLSTFAIDVDTASYPMARKYLSENKLPPRAAIRSEEFLNYFDHNLVPPREGDFAVHMQAAPTPFTEGENNILLKVGVKGREVSSAERKPLNLVFVIDKSGSMKENNRMELVKRSLELLVDQLREDDRVGIVSFDSSGHIVMESTAGAERWKLREALRQMDPGGSTNAAEGLYLGYEMLSRNYQDGATNRVILASDGVANTGETDQQRILDRIADFTTRQVDLTTIGVGMNNHNDVFLEQMANKGDGSCHYVDNFDEAKHVFIDRFSGTMQTIARDVKIQVEFDNANVLRWRQIGYENRSLQDNQFRDDRVDAGEVGAGHEIVALYEVQLKNEWTAGAEGSLATVRLRWKPDGAERSSETGVVPAVEQPFAFDLNQVQQAWKETSAHFRLAAVTAQYAEFMRRSYHVRGDSYATLQAAADRLAGELAADKKVRELSTMITETRRLVQFQPPSDELWQLIEQSRRLTLLHQELHHIEKRNEETQKLMAELQAQNAELEERIRQHLDGRN
jgi:Ca-activated chloride channel homolog